MSEPAEDMSSDDRNTSAGRPLALIGACTAALVAVVDFACFRALGVAIVLGERDVFVWVAAFFVASFAAFGWVIGRSVEQRRALSAQRATIGAHLEQLRAQGQALAEAERLAAIGRLAAGVAHEVRNPLGVIRSSASLILEDLDGAGDGARAATFIREEVDRLDAFVTELLDFSKPVTPSPKSHSASSLVAAARGASAHTGLDVEVERDAEVCVDDRLFVPVLATVLINAADAGASRVGVTVGEVPEGIRMTLIDDGPGFDANTAERAFDPFFTTRAKGTGLGLAMAARVVDAHGGTIRAHAGSGGRIEIQLPEGDAR